jgi:hypothetical protein
LIGKSVENTKNETIGEISDLVADKNGKIVVALIHVGGFIGIGGKDVAVGFEDLKLVREDDHNAKVLLDLARLACLPGVARDMPASMAMSRILICSTTTGSQHAPINR